MKALRFLVLVVLLHAQSISAATVRLITIGPGDAFWSAFGHTAIAIDNDVYAFGYFSFDEDTFSSFVSNNMFYDAGLSDLDQEIRWAQQQNRDFSSIELNLTAAETQQIADYLNWHLQPENQSYQYDYFLNNCSTKVRDTLNTVWNQTLQQQSEKVGEGLAESTYFAQTFPAKHQGLMNFGLALGYGWSAYTTKNSWQLMALPVYFEQYMLTAFNQHSSDRVLIFKAESTPAISSFFQSHWFMLSYVLLWSGLLVFKRSQVFMAQVWYVWHGMIGSVLLALWLLTPHLAMDWNFNVLLLSPLGLLVVKYRFLLPVVAVGWAVWLLLAVYLGAWYLMPLLIPSVLAHQSAERWLVKAR